MGFCERGEGNGEKGKGRSFVGNRGKTIKVESGRQSFSCNGMGTTVC